MIIIFAGHHPQKPGACFNGFCEHDEALRWLDLMREMMPAHDLTIGPVGTLKEKTQFVNERKPLLAVDLHFNAAPRKEDGSYQGAGSMTLYYPGSPKGKLAAEATQAHVGVVFTPDLGAREGYYRLDPKRGADWFLARTTWTSLIVEPEYIHNKAAITGGREAGAVALCQGLSGAISSFSPS